MYLQKNTRQLESLVWLVEFPNCVAFLFLETFTWSLIPHRAALQAESQRRSVCDRNGKRQTQNNHPKLKQRFSSRSVTQHCFYPSVCVHLFNALPLSSQSAGCSHSVRANVQSVLSLLKRHQPHLCNRRVLSTEAKNQKTGSHKFWDASSPSFSSAAGEEELSGLLRALQEEMRLMSLWVRPQQTCDGSCCSAPRYILSASAESGTSWWDSRRTVFRKRRGEEFRGSRRGCWLRWNTKESKSASCTSTSHRWDF